MNDIYTSPESDLNVATSSHRDFKLYTLTGMGVATFFGTPIAGGFLLSRNYKALGMGAEASKALWISIGGTILFILALMLIEQFVALPQISYAVPQVIIVHQLAKYYQGEYIEQHQVEAGLLYSNWRAFGISLLIMLAVLALTISLALIWVGVWGGGF